MKNPAPPASTRRRFLRQSGTLAAGATLLSSVPRNLFAADDQDIRLAIIGCGNRGAGAVRDALSVPEDKGVKLWAMADLREKAIQEKHDTFQRHFPGRIEVPKDRQFLGWDAYKHAIDTLRPGDVAMCTTRAYIRPYHVAYAVEKGVNVFMEKPFASDPAGLHHLLETAKKAKAKGLKIAAGLQCRHSPARQALIDKIRDGELGDINLIRANRLGRRRWMPPQGDKALSFTDQLEFGKVQLFWVGSGHMVDNLIHQIDEVCWIKDAWPVSCVGLGGREPGTTDCGQNHDFYSMEYTFSDGAKAFCGFRRQKDARNDFATYLHGTKKAAQFSGNVHAATVRTFEDQRIGREHIDWTPPKDIHTPWQFEWNAFIASIRADRPHNEAQRAAYSDLASIMGRAACHSGKEVTWEQMMQSRFKFIDDPLALGPDSPPPVLPDEEGRFPVPGPDGWSEI